MITTNLGPVLFAPGGLMCGELASADQTHAPPAGEL